MIEASIERKCKHYDECERLAIPGSDCCAWCGDYDRQIAEFVRARIDAFASKGYERMAAAAGWSEAEMHGIFKGYRDFTYSLCDHTHKAKLVAVNSKVAAIDYGSGNLAKLIRRDRLAY